MRHAPKIGNSSTRARGNDIAKTFWIEALTASAKVLLKCGILSHGAIRQMVQESAFNLALESAAGDDAAQSDAMKEAYEVREEVLKAVGLWVSPPAREI